MRDSRNNIPIKLEEEMRVIFAEWCKEAKKDLEADSDFDEYYEKHASKELKKWYEKRDKIKEEAFKAGVIID